MKKIALFLALLFATTFVFSQDEKVIELKNDGVKHYQAKEYDLAIEKFKEALNISPNDSDITSKLILSLKGNGAAKYEAKEFDKALVSFHEALKLSPEDIDIVYKIGLSAFGAKQDELAIKSFTTAIEKDYKPSTCYFYITSVHKRTENFPKMIETLEQGLAAFPNDKNLNKLAPSCYQSVGLKDYNEAVAMQKQLAPMAQKEPDKYKVEIEKANVIFKKSLDSMTKAYNFDKENKNVLKALIAIHKALKDEQNAKKYETELNALGGGK